MTWSCESRRACRDASRAGSLCALKQRALACSHWDCSAAAAPCLAYVTCSGLRLCSVSTAAKASMSAFRGSRSLGSDRMAGGGPPRPSRARARPGRLACSTSAARRTRTTWPSWPTCSRTCAGAPLRSNPTLTLHRGLQDRRTCVPAVRTPSYGGLASAWARGLAGWEAAPPASRARAPHAARARRAGATRRWFVLDELDAFARRPKQALLYTLLDALHRSDMQARAAPPPLGLTPGAHCNHACVGCHHCNRHRTRCKAASALRMAVLQGSACSRGSAPSPATLRRLAA